jgi:hypothetical protein
MVSDWMYKRGGTTETGRLNGKRTESILVEWLQYMCRPKGTGQLTQFQWEGFYLFGEEILRACHIAMKASGLREISDTFPADGRAA